MSPSCGACTAATLPTAASLITALGSNGPVSSQSAFLGASFPLAAKQLKLTHRPIRSEGKGIRSGPKSGTENGACKEDALQRREVMKRVLAGGLAGVAGLFGKGPKDSALADIWPSEYDYTPVANKTSTPAPVKYRETKNATPFTITYPDRFVEALNRKPGVEVAKDDGEETLALIGDFKTFDTVSVLRYPIQPGTPGTISAEEISEKLIIGGNIATEFLRREMEVPEDPSQGNKYHFEYVTEQCRGEVVEGLGGKRECFRGDQLLPPITRHHLVNVEAFKGFFYVVTGSAAQNRWADAKSDFEQTLSSFTLAEPPAKPTEA